MTSWNPAPFVKIFQPHFATDLFLICVVGCIWGKEPPGLVDWMESYLGWAEWGVRAEGLFCKRVAHYGRVHLGMTLLPYKTFKLQAVDDKNCKDFWYFLCSKTKHLHLWGKVRSQGWAGGSVGGLQIIPLLSLQTLEPVSTPSNGAAPWGSRLPLGPPSIPRERKPVIQGLPWL